MAALLTDEEWDALVDEMRVLIAAALAVKESEELLEQMQTEGVRLATSVALHASPYELGMAAVAAARKRRQSNN